jgi:hypothetical protein
MDNEKVEKLLKRIDKALVDLAKATGAHHISIYKIGDHISIYDATDLKDQKFNYYRSGNDE